MKYKISEITPIVGAHDCDLEKDCASEQLLTDSRSLSCPETVLEVDINAILHNYNVFRSKLRPETKLICMVKADGYGMGAGEIGRVLQKHQCDYLAVAITDEGRALRREGISMPVIVLNPEISDFNHLFENRLEPEVFSFRILDALIKETERHGITSYPVHIKIDTGMHRLGFQLEEIPELCRRLKSQGGLYVHSVFSHLAGSDSDKHDSFTVNQIEKFVKAVEMMEKELGRPLRKHILNSAGIERFTKYQFDGVRLGIGLYGISADDDADIKPVCTLKTSVLQIRNVPTGDSIGYGRRYVVNRDSRIAVVRIGYADGLDRGLSNGAGVFLIRGKRCPVVGNICMDICMADVTDTDAQEGDEVIVFGKELDVREMAGKLDTIPYEIFTSVSPRVKRIYI